LNVSYGPQWIGRGGRATWPPRSPNLNSCDFYLWGYMKSTVYQTTVNNQDDLLNRIMMASERIRNDQDEFARVSRSLLRRANAVKNWNLDCHVWKAIDWTNILFMPPAVIDGFA
jgi:hypothetical protein